MESLHRAPLHHGFYNGVCGGLHQQAPVPVGVQGAGELLETTVVHWTGAGSAANRSRHCLDSLPDKSRD